MSPVDLSRRRERRKRLRSVKHKEQGVSADGSRSLHQLRRSDRSRSRSRRKWFAAEISLKKRAIFSHLRRRGLKAPVTAADESPETTSPPPPPKEKKESPSARFFSNPLIRWTEEERDLGPRLGKQRYKVGSVFDPESDSWVVQYNLVINPMAPGSNGIRAKIICGVCGKLGHLHTTCALTFVYPPDSPDFNRQDYHLVCECGSKEIVPGRRSCADCQPNSGLRVEAKELPPPLDYDNPHPDPNSPLPPPYPGMKGYVPPKQL